MSEIDFHAEAISAIDAAMTTLTDALDPEKRAAEAAEKLKPFDHEWKYAPASERANAERRIREEQQERAGLALFGLGQVVAPLERMVEDMEREESEPPTPIEARALLTTDGAKRAIGMTLAEQTNFEVLDELRRARFARELASPTPTKVLAAYERARKAPFTQENASLIRLIEHQHADGWRWELDGTASEADVLAVRKLAEAVRETRAGRISEKTRALQERIARARALQQRATDLHKVRAQRIPSRRRDDE